MRLRVRRESVSMVERRIRVRWLRRGSHLPHGWASMCREFSTEQAARDAMGAAFPADVTEASVQVDAGNRWATLGTRKRRNVKQAGRL